MAPRSKKIIVVWDWNGTLVDDAAIFVSIMNSFLQKNSLKKINLKEYKNHFCFPVENYYKKLGFKLTNKEFQALSSSFIDLYKSKMFLPSLKRGLLPIIKYLFKRDCVQLVVSAQEQGLLLSSVKYYGLDSFFDGVFGLHNNYAKSKVSVAKKHVEPMIDSNTKVLFIGDTVHDCEVASSVGAQCCLVSWGHYADVRFLGLNCFIAKKPRFLFNYIKSFINN